MPAYRTTAYRVPNEPVVLGITLVLVLGLLIVSATVTMCASGLFAVALVALAYEMNRSHHRALLRYAHPVTDQSSPALAALAESTARRLQPGRVEVFVVPGQQLNAYTFGVEDPKTVVLYAPLLEVMDSDELTFIMGHEMGHVALGHTWLNTILGGMAGIPSPFGAALILAFAFRWWNRACEYSADRAGLLACGNLQKATSALVKLTMGSQPLSARAYAAALARIDAEDDTLAGQLQELLSSHPMLIRRINELRQYAASADYARLQSAVLANTSIN